MVLSKPIMTVTIRVGRETDYGTPQPVVIVDFDEQMHWRVGEAFLHRMAAEISMLSIDESWSVQLGHVSQMGRGHRQRAVLKLELSEGDMEEARRGAAVLEQAVEKTKGDKFTRVVFQGE